MMIHQDWVAEMVKRGIFISSHHNHFMNAAVSDDDIKQLIQQLRDREKYREIENYGIA